MSRGVTAGASLVVGVIADTHGLLRPEAVAALRGCASIVHVGDVGRVEILERLGQIAPTVAIRGNVDRGAWAAELPATLTLSVGGLTVYVLHDLKTLGFTPPRRNIDVVLSGHSHRPAIETKGGVLYVNPGSAGPRRFSLPVTVARLMIGGGGIKAKIVDLKRDPPRKM